MRVVCRRGFSPELCDGIEIKRSGLKALLQNVALSRNECLPP
jgi:hypothetical protein